MPMSCGWPFKNVTSSKIARVLRLTGLKNLSSHICQHLLNSNTHPLCKWDSDWDLFTHQLETLFGKQQWQEQWWPTCVWSSSHPRGAFLLLLTCRIPKYFQVACLGSLLPMGKAGVCSWFPWDTLSTVILVQFAPSQSSGWAESSGLFQQNTAIPRLASLHF